MSDTPHADLEHQLAGLTCWDGASPALWKQALRASGRTHEARAIHPAWLRRWMPRLGYAAAAAAVMIAVGVSLSDRRTAAPASLHSAVEAALPDESAREGRPNIGLFFTNSSDPAWIGDQAAVARAASTSSPPPPGSDGSTDRWVIRKSTIELQTRDVRGAFLKALQLVSEADGEFVQESGLVGDAEKQQGNLTLRVTVARLPAVLQALRELGKVQAEQTSGQDVTGQVVDTEARLRNEQRVEAELLDLLKSRNDAPLKEILELRTALGNVRQSIEQLTAQRERLGKLVALASVLVLIRSEDAPPPAPPAPSGIGAFFAGALGDGWDRGLRAMIESIAFMLRVMVASLPWLALLAAAIAIVRLARRRTTHAG